MSNDLKDILSNSNKDIDNQQIMDYLSQHLSPAGQHEVEENMMDDPFMNDAVEGLQQLKDQSALQPYVDQLNTNLYSQISKNKTRSYKRRWKDNPQTYVAMIIIFILIALSFVAIKKFLRSKNNKRQPTTEVHSTLYVNNNNISL